MLTICFISGKFFYWSTLFMKKRYRGPDYLLSSELQISHLILVHIIEAGKAPSGVFPPLDDRLSWGHLLLATEFVSWHNDCFCDIILLSTVATASQFFISYTIRTFGALAFATIMITRQAIVFSALYTKSFLKSNPQEPSLPVHEQSESASLLNGKPR